MRAGCREKSLLMNFGARQLRPPERCLFTEARLDSARKNGESAFPASRSIRQCLLLFAFLYAIPCLLRCSNGLLVEKDPLNLRRISLPIVAPLFQLESLLPSINSMLSISVYTMRVCKMIFTTVTARAAIRRVRCTCAAPIFTLLISRNL